jgi:uncharacterized protein YndB with AHSA1/START domain
MSESIRLTADYPHAPPKVWRALTDPAILGEWLMPNDFAAEVGRRFTFRCEPVPREFEGQWGGVVRCRVLEVDPPRRLSYTWEDSWAWAHFAAPTVVVWTLEAIERGTRLTLEHRGFEGPGTARLRDMLSGGWAPMLRELLPRAMDSLPDEEPRAAKGVSK